MHFRRLVPELSTHSGKPSFSSLFAELPPALGLLWLNCSIDHVQGTLGVGIVWVEGKDVVHFVASFLQPAEQTEGAAAEIVRADGGRAKRQSGIRASQSFFTALTLGPEK